LSDRKKKSRILPIKKCKKKKPIAVLKKKKKERQRQPAPPTPKRSKKSILIFGNFFAFLAPPAGCGSNEYHVHRSEVNIYRVMTRNVSAVFKEESTLL
jgi:hypothetical protein